jgi:hypothetical protein
MNFLLDRFPIATFKQLKKKLQLDSHIVKLAVLTIQSKHNNLDLSHEYLFDRDISLGLITKSIPMILDKNQMHTASKFEGLAISIFSRYDTTQGNFSTQEMCNHYYELYNFWLYKIKQYSVDFCLHHYMPHDPSSLVLYLVLKNERIPTIFLDAPHIFNEYRFLSCSFNFRYLLLEKQESDPEFKYESVYFKYKTSLVNQDVNSLPKVLKFRTNKNLVFHSLKKNFLKIYKTLMESPASFFDKIWNNIFGPANTFFKISRYSWGSNKNNRPIIINKLFYFKTYILLIIRFYKYEAKCIKKLKSKYIYFPMPAQPEGSTLPAALEFRDVILTLRILREAIPSEIPIYLKENLSVFEIHNPYLSAVNYRSPDFYDQISMIPNLKFISAKADSHSLIKNSLSTATINGTAAIEAISFNIPAVTFASNWYDNLEGIHKYISISKLKVFFENIISKSYDFDPNNTKFKFDKNILIKFTEHDPYEIEINSRNDLILSFINSINKFEKLDDRKWEI